MSSTGRYWYWEVLVGHVHYVLAQVLVALVAAGQVFPVSAHLPINSPTVLPTCSPYFLELSRTSTATISTSSHFPHAFQTNYNSHEKLPHKTATCRRLQKNVASQ